MSVNKYLPHLLVLPEDDANRQIANGFLLYQFLSTPRLQILEEVGGWRLVLERFCSDHANEMDRYPERFMALLIDFDNDWKARLSDAKKRIPRHLIDRVFVLGTMTEPEKLRPDLGSFETIGLAMAKDCRENTATIWGHRLLCHNADELERLSSCVRPWLFP